MMLLILAMAVGSMVPPFRVVDKGSQSGVDDAKQVVVRTAEEWTTLWRVHGMDRDRPPIDFTRDMVVGVFMGSRPTAGYDVEIVGVSGESGTTVVRYREKKPARDAITAQVLTSPYVLVAIPRAPGDVRFEKVQ